MYHGCRQKVIMPSKIRTFSLVIVTCRVPDDNWRDLKEYDVCPFTITGETADSSPLEHRINPKHLLRVVYRSTGYTPCSGNHLKK